MRTARVATTGVLLITLVGCSDRLTQPADEAPEPHMSASVVHGGGGQDLHVERQNQRAGGPALPKHRATQRNIELLGALEIASTASDIWVHGTTAYVGGFRNFGTVKIIDVADPANPVQVGELPAYNTSQQDVKVATINTAGFNGDLLVVSEERGYNSGGTGGVRLWDVSNPSSPVELSAPRFDPRPHNTYLYQQGSRAFLLVAIEFNEYVTGVGDLVVMEVTDPRNPVIIADWGAQRDAALEIGFGGDCPSVCRGSDFQASFLHDVWANETGTVAYLSYWDLGLILLDISTPDSPTLLGHVVEPPTFGSDEGNAHNAVSARGGDLVLVGDEDFTAGPWGFLRIFDTSNPASPVQVGAYATKGALRGDQDADASLHNIWVTGDLAFLSWYSEGVRVVDFSTPHRPREVATFVPDEEAPGSFWGIYEQNGLIYASATDFRGRGALYILRLVDEDDQG